MEPVSERPPISALVAGADARGEVQSLLGAPVSVFESPDELLAASTLAPGIVLVGPGVAIDVAARIAAGLFDRARDWIVVMVERSDRGLTARPISLGFRQPLSDLVAPARGDDGMLLELGAVLDVISRARHDINNPLTTMLAETQLLLMDVADGEVRASLQTIERQIRRVRDLVASLSVLRPPER